jgi:hypothetical protein
MQLSELKADLNAYVTGKKQLAAVHAGRFVLVDETGKPSGFIRMDSDKKAELVLENNRDRITLGFSQENESRINLTHNGVKRVAIEARDSALKLYDQESQNRFEFSLGDNGTPRLGLYDSQKRPRFILSLERDGQPNLLMFDEKNPRLILVVDDKQPRLGLNDAQKRVRCLLSLDPDGQPNLIMADEKNLRLSLDVGAKQPRLIFFDAAEGAVKQRMKLFLWPTGVPEMQMQDSKGQVRFVNRLMDATKENENDELPLIWMIDRNGKDRTHWGLFKGGVPDRQP